MIPLTVRAQAFTDFSDEPDTTGDQHDPNKE